MIHEAWPQDQFEYYAKEVFMMKHLDESLIKKAFSVCDQIIFPSNIQMSIYTGLFPPSKGKTGSDRHSDLDTICYSLMLCVSVQWYSSGSFE